MNDSLDGILEMTRRVLTLVEAGEWSQAAQVDTDRRQQLQNFCAALEPQKTPPAIVATLAEVLKLNDALIGAVQHRQRSLLREAETVKVGRRAIRAYAGV